MSGLAVDLYGYGRVARALLSRLRGTDVRVATIRDRTGLRTSRATNGFRRVLVDATSPQYQGAAAEEWVRQLEVSLSNGTPLVTCNKAPLAIAWTRLTNAAREGDATISCSATVGAGTPVLRVLRWLQQAHGVARVEATLNATLEYVFDEIRRGTSLTEAVRQAQRAGWAEPDPSLDLDGTDAYAKAVIIHNLLFPERRALVVDESRPRLRVQERRIRRLAGSGPPRALALVSPGRASLAIRPSNLSNQGTREIGQVRVRAVLRDRTEVFLAGRGAGSRFTAGGLLGDLLALSAAGEDLPAGVVV